MPAIARPERQAGAIRAIIERLIKHANCKRLSRRPAYVRSTYQQRTAHNLEGT